VIATSAVLGTAEGVIFDMDGVVTDTASVHEAAWTDLFNGYLVHHGQGQRPFGSDDYRRHVDGRARVDGVVVFLRSRGIELPLGDPADVQSADTAWGLANRKNALFLATIERSGVRAFPGTVALIRELRALDRRTAIVTASRNADRILAAAGVDDLFDAQVDGTVAEIEGLAGKPDPATFLAAARHLDADPVCSVVIEDAIAGVEAGRRGGFGLVVGVDRVGQAAALRAAGADVVVADLEELSLEQPLVRAS
jgi:beta-phosphoglucomutase family hydrolase